MLRIVVSSGLCIALSFIVCARAWSADDAKGIEFFEKKIRPVLVQRCYKCHSAQSKPEKGGLLLDTRAGIRKGGDSGPAVRPGKPADSLLLAAIQHQGGLEMPPDGKLPDVVIADVRRWIAVGAPDPRRDQPSIKRPASNSWAHWAFRPPKKQTLPKVRDSGWPRDEIDRFVLARLEGKGLGPNADADPMVLLRRVFFDLIGLPPTPRETDRWSGRLAANPRRAMAELVDEFLARPAFGQRWGRHWLDVARFAESAGQSRNISYRFAWPYRNWVIDALNEDKPYDRFVLEQIAGDLLPAQTQRQRDRQHTATAFLVLGPKLLNENNTSLVYRMGVVDDQIDTTFRAFMGLTVGCARCHDHKYDPIPTRDYYALAGIFRSTKNLAGVKSNNNDVDFGLYPLGKDGQKTLDEIVAKTKEFSAVTTEFTQTRRAKEALQAKLDALKKKGGGQEEQAKLQEQIKQADLIFKKVAQRRNRLKKSIPEPPPSTMAVREGKAIADSPLFIRGDVQKPGDAVPRGALQMFQDDCSADEIGENESGRLQLARWIASGRNPLTARVMANRVWRHLFGAGLVRTTDNFGVLGQPPSHPELLDHLALRFRADGWSLKRLIRAIVLSRTYRMSSDHNPSAHARDPDNRWLWRMSRRRLEGEVVRDAMLAAAGRLDVSQQDGSLVSEIGLFEMRPEYLKRLRESYQEPTYRSVYLPVMRAGLPDMLKVFDAADPSLVVGRRDVTTVAPQALFLLNNAFVLGQARAAGQRVMEVEGDEAIRVTRVYRLVLGRDPIAAESQHVARFVAEAGNQHQGSIWADLCHVLFASAEFRTLY